MRLLIVNAHPDDTEFTCASTIKKCVDLGWDVFEILMTCDEYGTSRDDFKGKRIRRIRKHEMEEATKVYGINANGTPKIKLIWFGEIDGYLPFNKIVFEKLKSKVKEINPDIVIGPDSFFSQDLHPDHTHTGWLVYLVVKSIRTQNRPQLWLYQSWNTNFYVKIDNFKIQIEGWAKHKSQTTPLFNKMLGPLRKIYFNAKRIKTGPVIAEGFRKVTFSKNENNIEGIINQIIYRLFACFLRGEKPRRYLPNPKQLGLI